MIKLYTAVDNTNDHNHLHNFLWCPFFYHHLRAYTLVLGLDQSLEVVQPISSIQSMVLIVIVGYRLDEGSSKLFFYPSHDQKCVANAIDIWHQSHPPTWVDFEAWILVLGSFSQLLRTNRNWVTLRNDLLTVTATAALHIWDKTKTQHCTVGSVLSLPFLIFHSSRLTWPPLNLLS